METRRVHDKTFYGRMKLGLRRIRTELTLILVCLALTYFLPREAILGIVALFITKALFVVIGVLVGHSSRKFLFPYLDMQKMIEEHHWGGTVFLVAWYGVIIWAFAIGG